MIQTTKLKNKQSLWNAQLRPRVLDAVTYNGVYYVNISGRNAVPTDSANWYRVPGQTGRVSITKISADIAGEDPDFTLDLSTDGVPDFAQLSVWFKPDGASAYQAFAPVNYDPVAKVIHNVNNPDDFPDQVYQIIAV